jgi:hypothetical protein
MLVSNRTKGLMERLGAGRSFRERPFVGSQGSHEPLRSNGWVDRDPTGPPVAVKLAVKI